MINMIRSINYSTRRNLAVVLTILAMIGLPFIMVNMVAGTSVREMSGSRFYATMLGEEFFVVIIAGLILSCIPSFADAGDKTLSYELMAGHSRNRVFAARTITGIFWGVMITAILYYLPVAFFGIIGGWDKGMSIRDVVMRILLSLFPMFRMTAFCIMMSSLFRSAGKGIGFSYLAIEVGTIIYEVIIGIFNMKEDAIPWFQAMQNVYVLHTINNGREFVIDGEKVFVYETAIPGQLLISTIAASVIFGIIYLTIAYIDFKKRDRD